MVICVCVTARYKPLFKVSICFQLWYFRTLHTYIEQSFRVKDISQIILTTKILLIRSIWEAGESASNSQSEPAAAPVEEGMKRLLGRHCSICLYSIFLLKIYFQLRTERVTTNSVKII